MENILFFSVAQDIISDFAAYELAERYQTNPEEVSEIFQNLPKLNILPTEDALTQIGCKFHTNHAKGYQKTMKRIQKNSYKNKIPKRNLIFILRKEFLLVLPILLAVSKPLAGPTIPRSSNKSMILAARLYPKRYFL